MVVDGLGDVNADAFVDLASCGKDVSAFQLVSRRRLVVDTIHELGAMRESIVVKDSRRCFPAIHCVVFDAMV